ncbi:MAG: galactose-1-phosphate uridylyltransferase [Candidatus Latescibacteria bacterium]|nr:galactose-1-phosphate uridylyltransferase [Candidatus Latescibacterota bacterium]
MPQLRKDPILGRWVIISTERGRRPSDFAAVREERKGGFCPFCPGNEDKTPPEILVVGREGGEPNSPGWTLRVIPNKFPALQVEGDLERRGVGMFDMMNGIGAHEVIVETPNHEQSLADLSPEEVRDVLRAYVARITDLKRDMRFRYILIFKNHGVAAGASLEHTHSQLIATPIVPKRVMEEMAGAQKYYEYKERCVFCDMIRQELEGGERIVLENEAFVALEPFAPRFPFETWILPKAHRSHFEHGTEEELAGFAEILKEALQRINQALKSPPYNYIIHTTPVYVAESQAYHWHLELMPKLTRVAGFEWGSGFYINPTAPEDAAKYLRELKLEQ